MKIKETAGVVSQEMLSEGIYSLTLSVSFADQIRAGQFGAECCPGRFLCVRQIRRREPCGLFTA